MAEEAILVLSEPLVLLRPRLPGARAFARTFACGLVALAALVSVTTAEAAAPLKGPAWAALTADQQQILAPLKSEWDKMDRQPRVKWVGIAKRFPTMTAREQRRIQTRMDRWAKLTPEQRAVARTNYRNNVGALPPEKKKELQAQWEEYRALPEHEKRSYAAKAAEQKPATPPKRPSRNFARPDAAPGPLAPNPGR
jgi:hypothetical protein